MNLIFQIVITFAYSAIIFLKILKFLKTTLKITNKNYKNFDDLKNRKYLINRSYLFIRNLITPLALSHNLY